MDRNEARTVLEEAIEPLTTMSRDQLVEWIETGHVEVWELPGSSGVPWQVEISALWDVEAGGTIRVLASIDDGSFLGALRPVCSDFLVSPDGTVDR